MYLLEYHKMPNTLSFRNEVTSLEFTGTIGEINITVCGDPAARNERLEKWGKQLFAEWQLVTPPPPFKLKRAKRKIIRALSQKEIDRLLIAINSDDKSAKGIEKYTNAIKRFFTRHSFRKVKEENAGVLSPEEIDSLLRAIKGNGK